MFEEISIPNWGGHWSYACAWMYLHTKMSECVWVHASVQVVAGAPLVPSCKLPWSSFFFWCPIVGLVHFVIPLLTTEFSVCVEKNAKGRTLDVNEPQGLGSLEFQMKGKNFPSCHRVGSPCVLCYSVCLAPVWSGQKIDVREPPGGSLWVWRHFLIHAALWDTPGLRETVGAFKGTAVLTQSVACNISSVIDFLYRPKSACGLGGTCP